MLQKATDYRISHCSLLWFTYNTVLVLPLMAVQVKAPAHTLSMVNVEFWRMRTIHRMVAHTLTKTKSLLTTPHKELTYFGSPLTNLVTHSVSVILTLKVLSCTLTTQGTWKAWSFTLMTLLQSSIFTVTYWNLFVCLCVFSPLAHVHIFYHYLHALRQLFYYQTIHGIHGVKMYPTMNPSI